MAAIIDVAKDPDERPRKQPNGRWRTAGVRDGVDIVALIEPDGQVRTAYPVGGTGVTRNPDAARDPANPTVDDLSAGRISYFAETLLDQLAGRLPADDLAHYRGLLWSGEWEELADVLAAHLATGSFRLSPDEHTNLEYLLNGFSTPLAGCAYLNDRDRILDALRPA